MRRNEGAPRRGRASAAPPEPPPSELAPAPQRPPGSCFEGANHLEVSIRALRPVDQPTAALRGRGPDAGPRRVAGGPPARDGVGERGGVAGLGEPTRHGVLDLVGYATGAGGDDGAAMAHRLESDQR